MRNRLSLFRRIIYAIALVRAKHFSVADDVESALAVLDKTFLEGPDSWVKNLPILAAIRYAYLYEKSDQTEKAIRALKIAVERLDQGVDFEIGPISKLDREYLYFYCKWLFASVAHLSTEASNFALTIGGSYQNLDMRRTSNFIKQSFPIPAEAGEQVDAIIDQRMPRLDAMLK